MLLIKGADYVVVSADEVLQNADVLVNNTEIVKVGQGRCEEGCERVLDAKGKMVIPGFVNTHTHLYQNFLKGMGDHYFLPEWMERVTFPLVQVIYHHERKLNDGSLGYAYGMLGAIEMLKSGITAFVDMDVVTDPLLEAWEDLGIRGVAALQTANCWIPKEIMISDELRLRQLEERVEKWHNRGLQDVWLAPSTCFACTEEFMHKLRFMAKRYGVGMQLHVAETIWEVENSLKNVHATPMQYLENIGFLDGPLSAVHCVHLTQEEMKLCKERGVSACYNPKSNGKLGNGIAPITELRELGVHTTLATDGAASNDLLDMFEEMRFGAMAQKIKNQTPARFGEKEIFRMATEDGAKLLGLKAGRLQAGYLADIVMLDCTDICMAPIHNPISSLVYCAKASNVETVMINGRFVMENKVIQTVNAPQKIKEAMELGIERLSERNLAGLKSEY